MSRIRRLALFFVLSLVAAACSSTDRPRLGADPTLAPESTSTTSTTAPPLAFADDDPIDTSILKVGVPRLSFVAPHAVDETDAVEVMITDLLTDGLTEFDFERGEARTGLAEQWTVSANRLVWTFTLGEHTFSTGAPITAADAAASLNRVAAMGIESLSGQGLWVIDGYAEVGAGEETAMRGLTVVDDRTLEIQLTQPYEPLTELLAGVAFGVFPIDIDTTGELPLSSSVRFRPTARWDDGFRMSALADSDMPDGIVAVEVTEDAGGDLLLDGDLDVSVGIPPELGALLGEVVTVDRGANGFYAMNLTKAPFDDRSVRRAIVLAIDRELAAAEFYGDHELMDRLLPTTLPGSVDDPCGSDCWFDRVLATELAEGSDSGNVAFTVDYFIAEGDDDTEQRLAEAIVSSLRDVGLIATARAHAIEDYGLRVGSGELGLFRFGSIGTVPAADTTLGAMFHSEGADNVTGSAFGDVDNLLEQARSTVDPIDRGEMYAIVESVLFSESVLVPLVDFQHHLTLGETVQTASLEPDGSLDLDSIVFASNR
ncbi:MAG: peptide ABC transporter substrate-binding protein [Acidimicrobiales bacterium]